MVLLIKGKDVGQAAGLGEGIMPGRHRGEAIQEALVYEVGNVLFFNPSDSLKGYWPR